MENTKTNIVFVDDEKNILTSLNRMLFTLRPKFNFTFFDSPHAALEHFRSHEVDILITDMKMPLMNGLQVLKQVEIISPKTIRVILSGQVDEEIFEESLKVAHRFYSKPLKADELKRNLLLLKDLADLDNNRKITEIISISQKIPTMPSLYKTIQGELQEKHPSINKIAEIIKIDISMTVKILRIVNSSFFGIKNKVTDVKMAISFLGIEKVKSLILAISLFEENVFRHNTDKKIKAIWNSSLMMATASKVISKYLELDQAAQDEIFLSSLIQDIGKIILYENFEDEMEDIDSSADPEKHVLELQTFGANHCQIGSYLLKIWNFSESITHSVLNHHNESIERNTALKIMHICQNLDLDDSDLEQLIINHNFDNSHLLVKEIRKYA